MPTKTKTKTKVRALSPGRRITAVQVIALKPCWAKSGVRAYFEGRKTMTLERVATLDIPLDDRVWLLSHYVSIPWFKDRVAAARGYRPNIWPARVYYDLHLLWPDRNPSYHNFNLAVMRLLLPGVEINEGTTTEGSIRYHRVALGVRD